MSRSDDGGLTWRSLYVFPSKDVSGKVATDGCNLYVQGSDGVLKSTDEGLSWQSIGGPSYTRDQTLQAAGGYLYAADYYQYTGDGSTSLWRYPLPRLPLFVEPASLRVQNCSPTDTAVVVAIGGNCFTQSMLTNWAITGSTDFSITAPPTLPDTLTAAGEQFHIHHSSTSTSTDTAYLVLNICTPTGPIDTSIMLVAAPATPAVTAHLHPALSATSAPAGSAVTVNVLPDRSLSNLGLDQVQCEVSWDDDLFDEGSVSSALGAATVVSTRRVGKIGFTTVRLTGRNLSLDPTVPIFSVQLKTLITDSTASTIAVSDAILNDNHPAYRCELALTGDSTRFTIADLCGDKTIRAELTRTLAITTTQPNPSNGRVEIVLANVAGRATCEVFDLRGNTVLTQAAHEGSNTILLSASGTYIARISDGRSVASARIVIEK